MRLSALALSAGPVAGQDWTRYNVDVGNGHFDAPSEVVEDIAVPSLNLGAIGTRAGFAFTPNCSVEPEGTVLFKAQANVSRRLSLHRRVGHHQAETALDAPGFGSIVEEERSGIYSAGAQLHITPVDRHAL